MVYELLWRCRSTQMCPGGVWDDNEEFEGQLWYLEIPEIPKTMCGEVPVAHCAQISLYGIFEPLGFTSCCP